MTGAIKFKAFLDRIGENADGEGQTQLGAVLDAVISLISKWRGIPEELIEFFEGEEAEFHIGEIAIFDSSNLEVPVGYGALFTKDLVEILKIVAPHRKSYATEFPYSPEMFKEITPDRETQDDIVAILKKNQKLLPEGYVGTGFFRRIQG